MQRALVGAADIHPRLLAHRLQTLQFAKLRGAVFLRRIGGWIHFFFGFQNVFSDIKTRKQTSFGQVQPAVQNSRKTALKTGNSYFRFF